MLNGIARAACTGTTIDSNVAVLTASKISRCGYLRTRTKGVEALQKGCPWNVAHLPFIQLADITNNIKLALGNEALECHWVKNCGI